MKRSILLLLLTFILGHWSASISLSQTNIESSTVSQIDAPLGNIMILHLGEDYDIRKTVEGEITFCLSKYRFKASPSNRYFKNKIIPTRNEIIEVLKANNFDGILTTVFTNIESKERFENPQSSYNLTPTSPTFYNFLDSYQNKYSTGFTIQEKSFIVETKLFQTVDEQVVYEASTQTFQTETLDMAVEDFSKTISKDLKKTKLLEKQK